MPRKPRLAEILVQSGLLGERELEKALGAQHHWGGRLGVTLVEMGLVEEQDLIRALSRKLGVPAVRLDGKQIDPDVLALVPRTLAEKHACLPLFTKREAGVDVIYLGMEDPGDLDAIDDVSFHTGMKVRPVIVAPGELWKGVERCYGNVPDTLAKSPLLVETQLDSGDTQPELDPADTTDPHLEFPLQPDPPDAGPGAPASPGTPQPGAAAVAEPEANPAQPPEQAADADLDRVPDSDAQARDHVPTRVILRAITELLIEREVISGRELFERIEAVSSKRGG